MPPPTVSWKADPATLRRLMAQVPLYLAGRLPDPTGEVRALQIRLGVLVLSIIRQSFIEKARGRADASGLKWKPLALSTIARRRAGKSKSTGRRGRHGMANARAGVAVEILRDTGRLLASLSPAVAQPPVLTTPPSDPLASPGVAPVSSYSSPRADQIFRLRPGMVEVGTNVEYAKRHHVGGGHVPARPLWADWTRWPPVWRRLVDAEIQRGVASLITALVRRGGR